MSCISTHVCMMIGILEFVPFLDHLSPRGLVGCKSDYARSFLLLHECSLHSSVMRKGHYHHHYHHRAQVEKNVKVRAPYVHEEELVDDESSLEQRRASAEVHESMPDDPVMRKGHYHRHYHYRAQAERCANTLVEWTATSQKNEQASKRTSFFVLS